MRGQTCRVTGSGVGADYTAALLAACGVPVERAEDGRDPHPQIEWARSGAMALTGTRAGAPLLAPAPLASCARAAIDALDLLSASERLAGLDGAALLGERAALLGLGRQGATAPGGSCRLLRAADGWLALNLARPDDVALLPAWLGEGGASDPWCFVAERVRTRGAAGLVERARLLGLPAALAVAPAPEAPPWHQVAVRARPLPAASRGRPLVVDLSSLWAGPLCTHLLRLAGARVIKLESRERPDGARRGPAEFFALLNGGKESVVLDFASERERLRRLVERADIVVESARPRALAQLGLLAEELVEQVPGLTWVSITGYGRRPPEAGWVAFGDDAAVAAGLAVATGGDGAPLFCADAIADPLAGMHAAVAALASFRDGGGRLLDVPLRDVVAHVLGLGAPHGATVRACSAGREVLAGDESAVVAQPRARPMTEPARPLGADTEAVLAELSARC